VLSEGDFLAWLVIVFQHLGIMFRFVDEGQFNSVAFKLDSHAHLAAGIASRDVSSTASNTTRRIMRPCRSNRRVRFRCQSKPRTPVPDTLLQNYCPISAFEETGSAPGKQDSSEGPFGAIFQFD
jgi:hypothetical protein